MALAAGVTVGSRRQLVASLNPLRCSGTALPPQLLLAAKMIVLGLLLKGYIPRIPGIFIPMWPVLDLLPRPELAQPLMQATVAISAVMLLCNRWARTCAFLIGATYILATLASRGFYSNGRFFCSSILMLIGLYGGEHSIWPVRWQFVILYFGSAVNKITQADWRSGWYFENWMIGILERDWYAALAAALPPMALSQFFCWATITIELSIATGLAVPRLYRLGIWLALLFHFSAVALTQMMYGIFVISISFSLLAFVPWPGAGEIKIERAPRGGLIHFIVALAKQLDFDRVLDGPSGAADDVGIYEEASLEVQWRDRIYTGSAAVTRIALSLPVTYFVAALGLILPSLYLRWLGH